jgi:peptidoglycan/LPS O-acetylase OafA/YrhL
VGRNLPSAAQQSWQWITHLPFRPTEAQTTGARLHEIDGLRGWAALSVVVFHLFWETFGVLMPSIRNPITGFLLDGKLAVSIFFVLSGEALSSAYFNGKGDLAVIKLAVKRYSRLTIPILAVSAIIYCLLKLNLVHSLEASQIVRRQEWLGSFLQIPVTLEHFLKYAFFSVYTNLKHAHAVNPLLWTMRFELLGSLVVFGILLTFRYIRAPWLVLIGAALAMLVTKESSYISCFMFGMLFSTMRTNGSFLALRNHPKSAFITYIVIIIFATADGIAHYIGLSEDHKALVGIPLVFAVFCNRDLCQFFSNRLSRFLGTISFPIYLVQFPVLISFTSSAILYCADHGGLNDMTILGIGTASLALSVACAYAFIPVETLTRYVGTLLVRTLVVSEPDQKVSGV